MKPELINGGLHEDARGHLRFVNDFDLTPVKRFYTISNSAEHPERGWIMHKRETKWFFPLDGITVIKVDDEEFTLNANKPAILCVPPNHWFCITQYDHAEVQVFSNCFVGEFPNDDFRRPIDG